MEKGIRVKDIMAGSRVQGIFVVKTATLGQTRSGVPYWNMTLLDASGSIDAKIWHPLAEEYADIPAGAFVDACGNASNYRDRCQLVIERLSILDAAGKASLDLAEFMAASPFAVPAMFNELMQIINEEFSHEPWRAFLHSIFNDEQIREAFCLAPAATNIHHAYAGGLLEHTLSVTGLCRMLSDKYPELDRQTLLAGAMLHDLGKIREMTGGLQQDYTQEGRLLGHIFLGISLVEPFLAASDLEPWLMEHLRHLILSHHGQLEYGAARLPQTAEAFALHFADNIDARMAQCRSLFAETDEPPVWSRWQSTLNCAILLPRKTPAANSRNSAQSGPAPAMAESEADAFYDNAENYDEPEPTAADLNEIYADPAFNAPPWEQAAQRSPAAGNIRANKQDRQCSLL